MALRITHRAMNGFVNCPWCKGDTRKGFNRAHAVTVTSGANHCLDLQLCKTCYEEFRDGVSRLPKGEES